MSEDTTKDTAERPEMTDEERQQLKELKAKEATEAEATAKEAEAVEKERKEYEKMKVANRPLHHVLIRHMARSPRTRTQRAARAGHRRQGVVLDDGTRIRKQGRGRYTEVNLRDLVLNHERFLEYVRVGSIEVCNPRTEHPLSYEELVRLIDEVGHYEFDNFKLLETGLQSEVPVGSNEYNTAPEAGSLVGEDGENTGLLDDNGNDAGEVGAEVKDSKGSESSESKSSESKSSESESSESESSESESSEEGESLTEAQLKKMKRSELNELAEKSFGVKDASKLPNAGAVIEAIFATSKKDEE